VSGIAAFLDMGGRAEFVWPAYGVTALVLVGLLLHARARMRARGRELERLEGRRRRDRRG
jgi:heme exporter protein D